MHDDCNEALDAADGVIIQLRAKLKAAQEEIRALKEYHGPGNCHDAVACEEARQDCYPKVTEQPCYQKITGSSDDTNKHENASLLVGSSDEVKAPATKRECWAREREAPLGNASDGDSNPSSFSSDSCSKCERLKDLCGEHREARALEQMERTVEMNRKICEMGACIHKEHSNKSNEVKDA